jgi:hypothetical protein
MHYPDTRLFVQTLMERRIDDNRLQSARNNVMPRHGEHHARPLLPIGNPALDSERVPNSQDLATGA